MKKQMLLTALATGGVLIAAPAGAHHASAPHYIVEETIEVTGAVVRWRMSNPHSHLTLEVAGADGPEEWVCETGGAAVVQRAGMQRNTLAAGDMVTLTAAPGRRDPHICLMRTITLEDGQVIALEGGAPPPAPPAEQVVNVSIFGIWTPGRGAPRGIGAAALAPAPSRDTAGSRPAPGDRPAAPVEPLLDHLTEAGRAAHAAYDPYEDDPAFRCSPVHPRRLWNAIGTGFEISEQGEDILIHFEFMDADRIVHMDETAPPADAEPSELGYSVGRWDGDALVVETSNFAPGVILQYVLDSEGTMNGLLHSADFTLSERIEPDPESDDLKVTFTYDDPAYFTSDAEFPTLTRFYKPTAVPIDPYNCVPDVVD